MKKKLVLFDFDGTITTKDTLIELLIWYKGPAQFLWGLFTLSPVLAQYFFRIIPNWKAKQILLQHFLGGEELSEFNSHCQTFSQRILPALVRPKALEIIQQYKQHGACIAVISASAENWVGPWCRENELICLATKLEVKEGKITGTFIGKNCFGEEKANRIREHFRLDDYDEIIAYGDSSGDREMLALAHQQFYKPFRD
jgi:phosphatidylglycerophosphatase C